MTLQRAALRGAPYAAALATILALAGLLASGARSLSQSLEAPHPALSQGERGRIGVGRADVARSEGQRPPEGTPRAPAGASDMAARSDELLARHLTLPVSGARAEQLTPGFAHARDARAHEALDIMAARGTPVFAVEDGRVVRLFWSDAGGHTIYQFDPGERFAYYYAHLDRYADGLAEQQWITRGQVIGYVGSTGNARADAPHLHFAIFVLTPEKRWWEGTAIDPYPILRWALDAPPS